MGWTLFNCSVSYVPNFTAGAFCYIAFGFLFTFGFTKFPTAYIRLCQRASLGETLRNLDLSFLYVKWRYCHIVHCFQRSVRKLKEFDISLGWKGKAKIIWKEKQGEIGFQKLLLAVILGETREQFTLTSVESEALPVCTTFWLCRHLSKLLSLCSFVSTYWKWGLIISILGCSCWVLNELIHTKCLELFLACGSFLLLFFTVPYMYLLSP